MSQPSCTRIVVGAGALGLFLAWELQQEYPLDQHLIYSRKHVPKPIQIKTTLRGTYSLEASFYFELKTLFENVFSQNVYFYICLPPEQVDSFFEKISPLLVLLPFTIHFVCLSNGIFNAKLLSKLDKKSHFSFTRGIVFAGFMRTIAPHTHTLVENTSGHKIYYGPMNPTAEGRSNSHKFTTAKTLDWENHCDIFSLERAKFFINLMLALYIGENLHKNSALLISPGENILKMCALHYSQLFEDQKCDPQFCYSFLLEAVEKTKDNINSISLAWHRGDTTTLTYFLNTLIYLTTQTTHINAVLFYKELLQQQGLGDFL